jgi:hypothetical protein
MMRANARISKEFLYAGTHQLKEIVMELIFGLLFELILDGSMNAATDKKLPVIFRILAAIILTVFYGGLVGLCIFWGIRNKSVALLLLGAFILIITILGIWKTYRKHRNS